MSVTKGKKYDGKLLQRINFIFRASFCEVCDKLNDPKEPVKVMENARKWYFHKPNGDPQCKNVSSTKFYSLNTKKKRSKFWNFLKNIG